VSAPAHRPVRPPRPPSRRARLVLLAASCLFALGVAELAVRLLAPQPLVVGDCFYRSDAQLGWTLAPGYHGRLSNRVDFDTAISIDDLGLRDGDPAAGGPAVLGLGDSFMFGYGVEAGETFLARAARAAGAQPLDAGVPGYDLCQAAGLGERLLPRLPQVAVIVIAPCLANDELDAAGGIGRMTVQHGYFVEPGRIFDPDSLERRLVHPLFAHSDLVRFLRFAPVFQPLERRLLGRESIDRRALESLLAAFREPPPPEVLAGDRATGACLHGLAEAATARRVAVLALLVPDQLEIRRELLVPTERAAGIEEGRFDLDGPRRRVEALLAREGIPVVDPSAALEQAVRRGESPWFRRDRHFTPAGSAVVGGVLAPELLKALARREAPPPAPGI
jgi:hypothetical protein